METLNQNVAKFRRMSSIVLQNKLKTNLNDEDKFIILKILKQRNVEIPVESVKEISQTCSIKENVIRKVNKIREKDLLSDYTFKPGEQVRFIPFRQKEEVIGTIKSIYQCKHTGYVYMTIDFLGKTIFKRANSVKKIK